MAALEPQIRAFCAGILDPFVGSGASTSWPTSASQVPMRMISMLLGIPESDQEAIRDRSTGTSYRKGPAEQVEEGLCVDGMLNDYVDWRATHPSDDLMTDLLTVRVRGRAGDSAPPDQ